MAQACGKPLSLTVLTKYSFEKLGLNIAHGGPAEFLRNRGLCGALLNLSGAEGTRSFSSLCRKLLLFPVSPLRSSLRCGWCYLFSMCVTKGTIRSGSNVSMY